MTSPGGGGKNRGRPGLSLDNLSSKHDLQVARIEIEAGSPGEFLDILRVGQEPSGRQGSITPKPGHGNGDEAGPGVGNPGDDGVVLPDVQVSLRVFSGKGFSNPETRGGLDPRSIAPSRSVGRCNAYETSIRASTDRCKRQSGRRVSAGSR